MRLFEGEPALLSACYDDGTLGARVRSDDPDRLLEGAAHDIDTHLLVGIQELKAKVGN